MASVAILAASFVALYAINKRSSLLERYLQRKRRRGVQSKASKGSLASQGSMGSIASMASIGSFASVAGGIEQGHSGVYGI